VVRRACSLANPTSRLSIAALPPMPSLSLANEMPSKLLKISAMVAISGYLGDIKLKRVGNGIEVRV
jgi:hypothetical protein